MHGIIDDDARIKEHADTQEEDHRESVLKRQCLQSRTMRVFAFAHHHACKKGS